MEGVTILGLESSGFSIFHISEFFLSCGKLQFQESLTGKDFRISYQEQTCNVKMFLVLEI